MAIAFLMFAFLFGGLIAFILITALERIPATKSVSASLWIRIPLLIGSLAVSCFAVRFWLF